jgi:hypothetical protein
MFMHYIIPLISSRVIELNEHDYPEVNAIIPVAENVIVTIHPKRDGFEVKHYYKYEGTYSKKEFTTSFDIFHDNVQNYFNLSEAYEKGEHFFTPEIKPLMCNATFRCKTLNKFCSLKNGIIINEI